MDWKRFCLVFFLIIGLLTPYVSANESMENADRQTFVLYFRPSGNKLNDLPLINEALNQYLSQISNFSVQLVFPGSDYEQNLHLALSRQQQVDIAFSSDESHLYEWVNNGWLCPLDELLQTQGQDILHWIEEPYMFRHNGAIYGISSNIDRGRSFGFEYLQNVADDCHIDMSAVHTLDDFTTIFQQIAEMRPDICPTVVFPGYIQPFDMIANKYGVLEKFDDTRIVNLFETEGYWHLLDLTYQWTQAGYTYDRFDDQNLLTYYIASGTVFGALTVGKTGFVEQEVFITGQQIGYLELIPYTLYSNALTRPYYYVIPKTSRDPKAAMELLNLLYNDSYIANLLIYGIEGLHYEKTTEYSVQKNPNSQYSGINGYTYCNQYTAYTFDGAPETLWQEMIEADATAPRSSAYGFLFDTTPVQVQIAQCDIVYQQYTDLLFSGYIDPQSLRQEFTDALRQAGIDDIIAEKQRQFDLFLAQKENP